MNLRWYVLRSKPNKEDALSREVFARGHKVFYPQIRVQPVNPRSRKVRPYFPGYMFVNIDLSTVGSSAFTWLPHSLGLVDFGSEPSFVQEELVHTLHRRVDEVNAGGGELFEGLKPGEEVTIQSGPFMGHEALFDARLPGSERVRVLLKLISKQHIPPLDVAIEDFKAVWGRAKEAENKLRDIMKENGFLDQE